MTETAEKPGTLEALFSIYGLGFLQDMDTALKGIARLGFTNEDFHKFVRSRLANQASILYEHQKQAEERKREFYYKAPKCSACGGPMALFSVNTKPCNQIGGDSKSMWLCFDQMECGNTVESPYEINVEAQRYGLEKFYPKEQQHQAATRRRKRAMERNQVAPPIRRPTCGKQ